MPGGISTIFVDLHSPLAAGHQAQISKLLVQAAGLLPVARQLLLMNRLQRTGVGEFLENLGDVLSYRGEDRFQLYRLADRLDRAEFWRRIVDVVEVKLR